MPDEFHEWASQVGINDGTHIQDQLASLDAACSGGIILEGFGQTVEGLELLIILLVLHLMGGKRTKICICICLRVDLVSDTVERKE